MSIQKARHWCARLFDIQDEQNRLARGVDAFMMALITANVVALTFETVISVYNYYPPLFIWFEYISVFIFALEYLLRLWTVVDLGSEEYRTPMTGRIRYALSPMALIDLLAIVPSMLPFLNLDMRSLRVVRMLRMFRIAKLARYSYALRTFGRVMRAKQAEMLTILAFLGVLLVLTATIMYYAERDSQPEIFSSIPATMWWAIATLTTVGYGDVVPMTIFGRILAALIAVLGIGVFALPTGILGAAFAEELNQRPMVHLCPKCGYQITSRAESSAE